MNTPIHEQIQAVLTNSDIASWALARLGYPESLRDTNISENRKICEDAVRNVFTLTRDDFENYIVINSIDPQSWFRTTIDSHDGYYFIYEKGVWCFYWQERGCCNMFVKFNYLSEARNMLINEYLGTWLKHLWVQCRTIDGVRFTL